MKKDKRDFKPTQVFDWESEPRDERPSEFVQSTGYSPLSGYYAMPDTDSLPSRRPVRSGGSNTALWIGALILTLGAAGLVGLAHLLRG